jgi:hypothetical protein
MSWVESDQILNFYSSQEIMIQPINFKWTYKTLTGHKKIKSYKSIMILGLISNTIKIVFTLIIKIFFYLKYFKIIF